MVWQETYGNTGNEVLHSITETTDGNYLVMGIADVNGDEVNCDLKGRHDVWVLKIAPNGNVIWQKCFGGSKEEANPFNRMIGTSDGGGLFISESWSKDYDATGHHKLSDVLTIKLDASGNMEWKRSFGGKQYDVPRSVLELPGERYVIVSRSTSSDGDVPGNLDPLKFDAWVFIVDHAGNMLSNNIYGGTGDDDLHEVIEDAAGNLLLFGFTDSNDGNLSGLPVDGTDAWLLKIDTAGNVLESKVYGQAAQEKFKDALITPDGGCMVFGTTEDPGIPVDQGSYHGDEDFWAVKLSPAYEMQWQGVYGGSERETMMQAVAAPGNSGFYMAGGTYSADGDVSKPASNGNDQYVIKISPAGLLLWSFTHGGTEKDYANSITSNGLIAGVAYSTDGDVQDAEGNGDGWIYKFKDKKQGLQSREQSENADHHITEQVHVFPNPATNEIYLDFAGNPGPSEITFLDVAGRVADFKIMPSAGDEPVERVDVSDLDAGVYFLQIRGESLHQTIKLIITDEYQGNVR